jgi:hypothetical protein
VFRNIQDSSFSSSQTGMEKALPYSYIDSTNPSSRRLETSYLCHYAHRADLEATVHGSAEVREWMVQAKLQLVRRYKGKHSEFAQVATVYAKAATERMEQWQGIDDGRRVMPVQVTFEGAKKMERMFPRPKSPMAADVPPCSVVNKARPLSSSSPVYLWKPKPV